MGGPAAQPTDYRPNQDRCAHALLASRLLHVGHAHTGAEGRRRLEVQREEVAAHAAAGADLAASATARALRRTAGSTWCPTPARAAASWRCGRRRRARRRRRCRRAGRARVSRSNGATRCGEQLLGLARRDARRERSPCRRVEPVVLDRGITRTVAVAAAFGAICALSRKGCRGSPRRRPPSRTGEHVVHRAREGKKSPSCAPG